MPTPSAAAVAQAAEMLVYPTAQLHPTVSPSVTRPDRSQCSYIPPAAPRAAWAAAPADSKGDQPEVAVHHSPHRSPRQAVGSAPAVSDGAHAAAQSDSGVAVATAGATQDMHPSSSSSSSSSNLQESLRGDAALNASIERIRRLLSEAGPGNDLPADLLSAVEVAGAPSPHPMLLSGRMAGCGAGM